MLSRQLESGAFTGDEWGEEDTRFLYCSVSALSHLKALDRLDKEKVVNHVLRCENFDGGFGTGEGGESHAAQGEFAPSNPLLGVANVPTAKQQHRASSCLDLRLTLSTLVLPSLGLRGCTYHLELFRSDQ